MSDDDYDPMDSGIIHPRGQPNKAAIKKMAVVALMAFSLHSPWVVSPIDIIKILKQRLKE